MNTKLIYIHKHKRPKILKTNSHSHDFWQLEIVTYGPINAVVCGENISLNTRDMLLIRSGCEHEFIYETSGVSWITLKFSTGENIINPFREIIRTSFFTDKLISSLEAIIRSTILEEYEKKVVEGHIESIFCYINSNDFTRTANKKATVISNVTGYIRRQGGKPLSVANIAAKLSYTRSHLSKEFKKQTGENLKSYIDRMRVEKAREMLYHSGFSISDISSELGFKDIFSFSRFFKQHTGASPKEYRQMQ